MQAPFVTITGPSGSGKSTIINRLRELHPEKYTEAVSTTTRAPRAGEVHGVNYFYTSVTGFVELARAGDLLESVSFSGYLYGIQKSEVEAKTTSGKTTFIVVEPSGLLQIRERYAGPLLAVYLGAPEEVLAERMRSRGDAEEAVQGRLKHDRDYFPSFNIEYDLVIVSGDLDGDARRLREFIEGS